MFRKKPTTSPGQTQPIRRVTSVLGPDINWKGNLRGSGGIRIEGAFEGEITIRGLVVVGETGRVNCENITANTVVVAGSVRGNISTERLEIRSTGSIWGDVITVSFSTDEGAFLRGQVRMEDEIDLGLAPLVGPPMPKEEAIHPIVEEQ